MSAKKKEHRRKELKEMPSNFKLWLEDFSVPQNTVQSSENNYTEKNFILNNSLINQLKIFCGKNKISILTCLQGSFGLLLNRYSGTDETYFGSGEIHINKKKLFSVIHPINPVISALDDGETLLDYLKKLENQLKKNKKIHKGYRYLFLFQKTKKSIDNKNKENPLNPNIYPFLFLLKNKKTINFSLLYNKEKFTENSIKNLADHFIVILDKISAYSEQFTHHYSILTKKEKKELLHEWNMSHYNWNKINKTDCVHDLFTKQAKILPNHPAVIHDNLTVSYQQLDEISNQIAQFILQKKIRAGDPVAVIMERTPTLIAIMLAIFKIGAIYVPVNPKYPSERIKFILDDCKSRLILADNTEQVPVDLIYKCIVMDANHSEAKKFSKHALPLRLSHGERAAYIIYTSGTTEEPKGVIVKHHSLINLINWYKTSFLMTANDRASQFSSQGFDTFFCETLPFLTVGASIHIIDDNTKLIPSVFLSWLAHQKITVCDLPTAYAQILFNMPWPENNNLRIVKIGGESILHYPRQSFSFDIWNTYGPTEGTIETTYIKIFQANTLPENQSSKHIPPPIGKPIANAEVYVVDHHLEPVPVGCAGELLIGGANLSAGYFNRAQLTREKFIRHLFISDLDAKLYRTGDRVRWLEDGNLEFRGGNNHDIKMNGYQIELNKIAVTLSQYTDVNELVVLERETKTRQKKLIAYLVPNVDRIRIPYQTRCLIAPNDVRYLQFLSEDISKEGVAINGDTVDLPLDQELQINLKLPGFSESQWLTGKVIWKQAVRAGIKFDQTPKQKSLLQKCIEYYLTTHNLMETLQSAAARRDLQKALKKNLPDYMIPTSLTVLSQFPLTFNGKIDWRSLPPPEDFNQLLERNHVAPRNEIEKNIADIWQNIFNLERVSITDNFFDYGANSLHVAELSVKILEKFNIAIPPAILFNFPFIPVIAEYIASSGKEYTYQSSLPEEIERDATLRDDLLPHSISNKKSGPPQHILLTSVTDYLGIYLLKELLEQTNATIYCLIHKGKFESAAECLTHLINQYELSNEVSLSDRRIILISGDVSLDQFGIPLELYHNLSEKIDLIYHGAAHINRMTSYAKLRSYYAQGTSEIIKFAFLREFF